MNKVVVFITCLFLLSCGEKNEPDIVVACGCEEPQKELPWLKELIQKAETDHTLNYSGCIWLEKTDEGKDIFVTNMMLGSGGVMYWFFDCNGNHYAYPGVEECTACEYVGNHHVYFDEDFSMPEMKKNIVIYSPENICE